jgi:hypothetical protein
LQAGQLILGRGQLGLRLAQLQIRRCGIEVGEELAAVDVLAEVDVHILERAAGVEVDRKIGAGGDVAAPGDGRLDHALLGGDDFLGRSRRAGWRSNLRHRQRRDRDRHDSQQVQKPGPRRSIPACAHGSGNPLPGGGQADWAQL